MHCVDIVVPCTRVVGEPRQSLIAAAGPQGPAPAAAMTRSSRQNNLESVEAGGDGILQNSVYRVLQDAVVFPAWSRESYATEPVMVDRHPVLLAISRFSMLQKCYSVLSKKRCAVDVITL